MQQPRWHEIIPLEIPWTGQLQDIVPITSGCRAVKEVQIGIDWRKFFAKSDLALHLDQRLLKEEDVLLEQGAALGLLDSFNPSHPRHNSFARDSLQNGAILKEDTQATTGRGSVARVLILKPMGLETHTNLAQDRGFVPMRKPGYAATQTGVLTLKLKGKSIVLARASPKSKTL